MKSWKPNWLVDWQQMYWNSILNSKGFRPSFILVYYLIYSLVISVYILFFLIDFVLSETFYAAAQWD